MKSCNDSARQRSVAGILLVIAALCRLMTAVGRGMLLAFVNTIVIAAAIQAMWGDSWRPGPIAAMVFVYGVLPAVGVGALLGIVAHALRHQATWLRILCVAVPALLLVIVLANAFGLMMFALPSCIPTLAGAFALERGTRAPPCAPVARVV